MMMLSSQSWIKSQPINAWSTSTSWAGSEWVTAACDWRFFSSMMFLQCSCRRRLSVEYFIPSATVTPHGRSFLKEIHMMARLGFRQKLKCNCWPSEDQCFRSSFISLVGPDSKSWRKVFFFFSIWWAENLYDFATFQSQKTLDML